MKFLVAIHLERSYSGGRNHRGAMEFQEAVDAHQAWKQRLKRILLGRERRRVPERTAAIRHADCPFHDWLAANAERFSGEPLFQTALDLHTRSHDMAIEMVLVEPEVRDTLDMVFRTGQFHMCSQSLLEALERLRKKYSLSATPLCPVPGLPPEECPPIPADRG